MGKCKRRTLNSKQNMEFEPFCSTRQEAISNIINLLDDKQIKNKKSQNNENRKQVVSMVSLFGITAEELSEAGANYEDLVSLGSLIN